ncbi:MAG: histidine kinase dimerization/phosphoacceptor domain-containing protein, partial [Actinomycetota bacterium]
MVRNALRSLLAEPAVPDAPGPMRRDWWLVAAFATSAVVEGALRTDLDWRPAVTVLAVALTFTLPWRRTHPLAMAVIAFGASGALNAAALFADVSESPGLGSMAYILLLPYSLFRWGSGRDVVIGLAVLVPTATIGFFVEWNGFGDLIGGLVIVGGAMAVGAAVRYRTGEHAREREQVKLLEREQLARELHDTVAHHVSAIAIQAQAGRALAPSRPDAALEALENIEQAAAESL